MLKEKLKKLYEYKGSTSFTQSPKKWLHENNIHDFDDILNTISDKKTTKHLRQKNIKQIRDLLKIKIHQIVLGKAYCEICFKKHERLLPGWKGFTKTCSNKCENKLHSLRQIGSNNSCHKMTKESKENMKKLLSEQMKHKILNGDFTPKSENYKTFGMISFKYNDEIRNVRSSWELLFWVLYPNLEYEKIRLPYYDTLMQKERVYIVDFYDKDTNTLYEVKPSKYRYTLSDKIKSLENTNFNYEIIDENFFKDKITTKIIEKLKNNVINYKEISKRLKWIN